MFTLLFPASGRDLGLSIVSWQFEELRESVFWRGDLSIFMDRKRLCGEMGLTEVARDKGSKTSIDMGVGFNGFN